MSNSIHWIDGHRIDNQNFNQDFKTLKWTDKKTCRLNETTTPYRASTEQSNDTTQTELMNIQQLKWGPTCDLATGSLRVSYVFFLTDPVIPTPWMWLPSSQEQSPGASIPGVDE